MMAVEAKDVLWRVEAEKALEYLVHINSLLELMTEII